MNRTLLVLLIIFQIMFPEMQFLYSAGQEKYEDPDRSRDSSISSSVAGFVRSPVYFREIWGYLQNGDESSCDFSWPVSDICYVGAGINIYGKLYGVPDRTKLDGYNGRVHLVVAEVMNRALTHFCLDPALPMRAELINAIARAAVPFDGVQIDFEQVPSSDRASFLSFLSELSTAIGKRTLSVALPARTRKITDAYDYRDIARIVDRIIVMAYDEHWSGSNPGSIASLDWCRKIADFARQKIPSRKLIMGLPFYGRAWGETNPSKAYRFSSLSKLMEEKNIQDVKRIDSIPAFTYEETIRVHVFYEDAYSVAARAKMYRDDFVSNIAFWRIGQEDPLVWDCLRIGKTNN